MGLITARSQVLRFEDEIAIVVERHDRRWTGTGFLRVHLEDICQALGLAPTLKYENEGGPGARAVVTLLRSVSGRPEEDVHRFVDAMAFHWLIAGTDAHARDYSLLIGAAGRGRLAPVYDIAGAPPYGNLDPQRLKLAMKIGGEYRLRDVGVRQWRKSAVELGLDPDRVLARVAELAGMISGHMAEVRLRAQEDGLDHPLAGLLADAITARARHCAGMLAESARRG